MNHIERFREWLHAGEYQPRTIQTYASVVEHVASTLLKRKPIKHHPTAKYAARIYLSFLDHFALSEDEALAEALQELSLGPEADRAQLGLGGPSRVQARRARQKVKRRKLEARSFSDEDWRRLHGLVRRGEDPADVVLRVLADTGLRVGDVLTLSRRALTMGLERGYISIETKGGEPHVVPVEGAAEAWTNLHTVWQGRPGSAVLTLLAPDASPELYSGHPAYTLLDRRFKALGAQARVDGRVHLHRIRRTIAVQALRTTGDILAVQQMLGHKSIATTQRYLDEARPDEVADIQRRVRERFADDDEDLEDDDE